MHKLQKLLNEGLAALNCGDFRGAETSFRKVIRLDKSNVAGLNLLVVSLMSLERFAEAEPFIAAATRLNQSSDISYYNYGLICLRLNKAQQAVECFSKAIALNRAVADTWNNRGIAYNKLRQYEAAISDFEQAITLDPKSFGAQVNKGKSLFEAKRVDDAVAAFDRALSIKSNSAEAWVGRGYCFFKQKNLDQALAAFDKALTIKADLAEAWVGRGDVFSDRKTYQEATASYNKALTFRPAPESAWLGIGKVLLSLGHNAEAIAAFDKALALKPDAEGAWIGRGDACLSMNRHDEAIQAYGKALSIDPDAEGAEGSRLFAKMNLCEWRDAVPEIESLLRSVQAGKPVIPPFALLTLTDAPEDNLVCARNWASVRFPASTAPLWQGEFRPHDKIRVGYASADFRQHAIAYLMAETFELHDKERFEFTAWSFGPDDKSDIRRRVADSFDRFVDLKKTPDEEAAKMIADSEIDILVDLMGYTHNARPDIFARRAAPIQVNFLGYPGTLGAPYFDYILGDGTIFATEDAQAYSEKLVLLPHTYQPNDRMRRIADTEFTRAQFGIPDDAFVFCCFNNSGKILPQTFDRWMRILRAVDGSVLVLLTDSAHARSNLKAEAAARGVNPDRIFFLGKTDLADHLARHKIADLFLDTLPYNAHTTASDALWTGLPVLTLRGRSFAGRVAASLLNAVGLPELVTHSTEEYERVATDLALDRERLLRIKEKLHRNRLQMPLFDTPVFTHGLEAAYEAMYQRLKMGLPPDHIEVKPERSIGHL